MSGSIQILVSRLRNRFKQELPAAYVPGGILCEGVILNDPNPSFAALFPTLHDLVVRFRRGISEAFGLSRRGRVPHVPVNGASEVGIGVGTAVREGGVSWDGRTRTLNEVRREIIALGELTRRLEDAWRADELDQVLAEEHGTNWGRRQILKSYSRAARSHLQWSGVVRETNFPLLVDRFESIALPRRRSYLVIGLEQGIVFIDSGFALVTMRVDQAVSAWKWGVGFDFRRSEDEAIFCRELVKSRVWRFGWELLQLQEVVRRFRRRSSPPSGRLLPRDDGEQFEWLIVGILNEHRRCAHQAGLVDDIFYKTDVYVRPIEDTKGSSKGKRSGNGSRVQVKLGANAKRQALECGSAMGGMRANGEPILVVSPASLAAYYGERGHRHADIPPDLFWQSIPGSPATTEELARSLRSVFIDAISKAAEHPFGALAAVAEPVRRLVQSFVHDETATVLSADA